MKSKLILCLALVLSGGFFACAEETNTPVSTTNSTMAEMRSASEFLMEMKKQGNLPGVSKDSHVEMTTDNQPFDNQPLSETNEAKYPFWLTFHVVMIGDSFITNNYNVMRASANAAWQLRAAWPTPMLAFMTVLDETGTKLGCHFTLEYRGYGITGKESKADLNYMPVRTDLNADSIPSLVSKLRDYLDGFIVVPDAKNPKIIHIIEKVLADDKNYALNKKISIHYSGLLGGTNVPVMPINGYATLVGGLLPAMAEKAGDIRAGLETSGASSGGGGGLATDSITKVNINATNETVRSIFTDCLPTANYNPVMWTAVTTKRGNAQNELVQCVLVDFFGPKKP